MSLLSDEQAQEIFKSEHCNISKDLAGILYRAIEAAVLEAQAGQEPVAWAYTINNSHSIFSAEKPPEDAYDKGTLYPLYAAPVVQPDMVMVPREPTEAMEWAVLNCAIYNVEYEEDVYLKNFAECYKFMLIAAAEGKK